MDGDFGTERPADRPGAHAGDPLDLILPRGDWDDFLATVYEREPFRVARNTPGWFDPVLTRDGLDRLIAERPPSLRLVTQSQAVPETRYTLEDGTVDPAAVFAAFDDGATIILDRLHRAIPALARLARALELMLHAPIQTNIYYTPAGGQGFRAHYDTHDVFVLQISGPKRWALYDTPVDLPLPSQGFERDRPAPGPCRERFDLMPGDTLYIPRGLMHEAEAQADTPSLHITVGVMARTLGDAVIDAVSRWAAETPEARRALPPGFATDPTALLSTLTQLVAGLPDALDLDRTVAERADALVGAQTPLPFDPVGRVAAAGAVTLDTPVRRRSDILLRLTTVVPTDPTAEAAAPIRADSDTGTHTAAPEATSKTAPVETEEEPEGQIALLLEGREVRMPDFVAPALAPILAGEVVRPRDLPGDLDPEEGLILCRRLLREGVIVPVETTPGGTDRD